MSKDPFPLGTVNFGKSAAVTEMTAPETELCHYIRDYELDMMSSMKDGHAKEIFWSSLGLFVGALVPALESLARFNAPSNPMGPLGLVICALALGGIVSAAISGYFWRQKAKGQRDIMSEIRARPTLQAVYSTLRTCGKGW